jgi:hypothetical protein
MGLLQSGGALEHYTNLREEVGRPEAEIEGLRQRLETAERVESTKADHASGNAPVTRTIARCREG